MNSSMLRIAIFFDGYLPLHENKDPGQLAQGLHDIGVEAFVVTYVKAGLSKGHNTDNADLVVAATPDEASSAAFWRGLRLDAAVVYTWLSPQYLPVQEALHEAGTMVVVKADTDGRLAPPLMHRSVTTRPEGARLLPRWIARQVKWRVLGWQRLSMLGRAAEAADAIIVESPPAAANLAYLLWLSRRPELLGRIAVLPNPVHPRFGEVPIAPKRNLVVAIGRWDDVMPKNTAAMLGGLAEFLSSRSDFCAVIAGPGEGIVQSILKQVTGPKDRMKVLGPVEHAVLPELLASARILLQPSRWESFAITVGEALCMGCSVVGTRIEPLWYLSSGGDWGTLAASFDSSGVAAALSYDAGRWDAGFYSAERIAGHWRQVLDRRRIAQRLLDLVERTGSGGSA
ncbi:MAG: glycosyltransferase family 4 protein [Limnochordaceae bacterium]|nr:glycosyltransferase family 4 protein [Limnochordaceae bacterium]